MLGKQAVAAGDDTGGNEDFQGSFDQLQTALIAFGSTAGQFAELYEQVQCTTQVLSLKNPCLLLMASCFGAGTPHLSLPDLKALPLLGCPCRLQELAVWNDERPGSNCDESVAGALGNAAETLLQEYTELTAVLRAAETLHANVQDVSSLVSTHTRSPAVLFMGRCVS